jgi:hypothetical protein
MLILLLCARDWSAFIFLSSPPSEISETVTRGNIFLARKLVLMVTHMRVEGFEMTRKPLELRYLQFRMHCFTAHVRDIVCGSCKHFLRVVSIAFHSINFDFKVREFETAQ